MANNYDLTFAQIDEVHIMNPELAAHNIALAYVKSAANNQRLFNGENVILSDVLSLSNQYVEAYNYAYNFVSDRNSIIDQTE